MDINQIAQTRHTCKVFSDKKITAEKIAVFKNILRNSASSLNLQPWHFIIASSKKAKEKIGKSADGLFSFNADKIKDCSHVLIICVREDASSQYQSHVIANEEKNGRIIDATSKEMITAAFKMFVDFHKTQLNDLNSWLEKQCYIALGYALLGAGDLGIDACPMEGIDTAELDKQLNLSKKKLRSLVVIPLGYSSDDDYNAKLPKSRLPENEIFTDM